MKIILLKIGYISAANISIFYFTLRFKFFMFLTGGSYGKKIKIDGKVFVRSQESNTITIGDNFNLNSRPGSNLVGVTNYASFQLLGKGTIRIGNNCGFTSTVLSARTSITIGNNVKIGGNSRIYDHDYHSLNYLERRNSKDDSNGCKTAPVEIGDDVFIGANSTILKRCKNRSAFNYRNRLCSIIKRDS
jgi:acetyltransferase-like isoleucine patch superfamily enzyme